MQISEVAAQANNIRQIPTWEHELELHSQGYNLLAGVDEVGRGAWAGPLVAAAVVFPHPQAILDFGFWILGSASETATSQNPKSKIQNQLGRLRDSKMLRASVREELLEYIRGAALSVGVGIVSHALIDVIGVGVGNRLAMARAVRDLDVRPDHLLLDAFRVPLMPMPQRAIIKGDATCMSIAAASIVAKVTRDRMMCELGEVHPGYSFAQHKGYGTRQHLDALLQMGVCPIHRRSYAPIKAMLVGEMGTMDDGR